MNRMYVPWRSVDSEEGWVVPAVLGMALVLQMVILAFFQTAHGHFERVVRQVRVDQADRLAELGWRWALRELRAHPDWRGHVELAADPGGVRVRVFDEGTRLVAVTEGFLEDGTLRSLRVEMDPRDLIPLHWEEGAGESGVPEAGAP
ncbi:MAG: hypothetical protein IRY98_08360 [Alicyclobacillaceae bacterium]|nr:hypothetical protein [Alicyclobacillaceae bacterium]